MLRSIFAFRILNINIASEKWKNIANEKYTLKMLEIHYIIIIYTLNILVYFSSFYYIQFINVNTQYLFQISTTSLIYSNHSHVA